VDQEKLEAAAIEADRLGALAYGRPHAFTLKVKKKKTLFKLIVLPMFLSHSLGEISLFYCYYYSKDRHI
jgi:hypothetical protein